MAENSKIEWTDATWNPITGCSITSPGCTNCYAMRLSGTRLAHHPSRAGLTQDSKAGPVWTGEVRLNEQWLDQPLRWRRPRRIFVCAHGDLFHESVPDEWIDLVFGVMAATRHTFQVLTKRPARMLAYLRGIEAEAPARLRHYIDVEMAESRAARQAHGMEEPPPPTPELRAIFDRAIEAAKKRGLRDTRNGRDNLFANHQYQWKGWPLYNVWPGVSVEDQRRADERLPWLFATPAAVRWVSAEPLLGPVDLRPWLDRDYLTGCADDDAAPPTTLDWVVAGGESGRRARPMHPVWVRSLRAQCKEAGVPFLFKQWGEYVPDDRHPIAGDPITPGSSRYEKIRFADGTEMRRVGKARAGRLLDGVLHDGFPGHA